MNIKRVIVVGTLMIVMTVGGNSWITLKASANPVARFSNETVANRDPLIDALNRPSEEELYDALYDGQTLADIASVRGADPDAVIALQTKQLSEQLQERLNSGAITPEQYKLQMDEVREMITRSFYQPYGT